MQNCGGRATFNMNYQHDELRTPAMLIQQGIAGLSIHAAEFVPKRSGPPMAANVGPHHSYPQQPQHPLAYQQQHLQQQQQSHLAHQPALYHHQQQQQQHHNNHHNMQPTRRAGGGNNGGGNGRLSVQDRLQHGNAFADHQQQQQHHHQQQFHIQQQHQQQQHHRGHHQQQHHQQQHLIQQQHHQVHHHHQQLQHDGGRRNHRGGGGGAHQEGNPFGHQHQQHAVIHHQQANNHAAAAAAAGGLDENPSDAELGALAHLSQVMDKLVDDPGMFETCQKEMNAVYIEFAQNCFVISNSIEVLFEQSINESNFRYMGARICRLLDGIVASPDSIFRGLLNAKMMDTQQQNKTFIKNEANKVRGCALFLAELFLQLQNDGNRIPTIADNIHRTLDELLQKLTPENIKCVCQTLKLCGYELEMDCPNEVANITAVLRQQTDVDVSTRRLINSVLEHQANRWGRNDVSSLSTSVPIEQNNQAAFTNEPVYYGPDGEIITEEESSFLSGIMNAATESETLDDDDLDPGMDAEMRVAFKDFMKQSNPN